ncbi:Hypothetical protein CINCED_3A025486 [Cinara cedri]|uniref:Uncharacterized protein n=1 Tax=Cinara cedri TaxID=506608 RepID=A0A5E4MQH0_9HEMI|nr:Hypothetical protein CINCED_3A025486 [Cinara cedri]
MNFKQKKTKESIKIIENCSSNENEIKKKKRKRTLHADTPLGICSDINNTHFEINSTKKNKKRKLNIDNLGMIPDKSTEEIAIKKETVGFIKKVENCSFKANEIKKKKGKRTAFPDSLFENNSVKNNTRFEVMIPTKKSKFKTNIDNVEININNSTEEMTINQDTEESIINNENYSSNENKKKHKIPVPTGASLENNSDINYRSLEVTPTKKKKRSKINLDTSDNRIEDTTRFQQETEELIQNVENCSFKANKIKKKKGKRTAFPDSFFENNSVKSNTRFEVMIPKKKSKYKTNADNVEININNSTEEMTNNQETEESIINIENHSSKENKKKHMTLVPTGALLENNSDINYRSLEVTPTKKKKRRKINLDSSDIKIDKRIEETTRFQQETEELIQNVENCTFKANEIKKKKGKKTAFPDSLFENNSEKNNARFEVMTPKKKSKYKTNADNVEININNSTEEMTINQDTEESIINNENKKKHKTPVPTGAIMENNSDINYRSLEVTPTKKKKRRKINLDSTDIKIDKRIEETTRLQQETEELIQNVENCTFKANEITKNEGKITDCPDIPFENNSVKSNARFEVMTPKKKSKYKTNADNVEININDSTEEMTNNQDTEESIINIENHSSKENKKKHMTPVPTGASLKNNCDINYRSLEESSTKKNKINLDNLEINIDKSIDEITKFQQETEEFVKNVENCSLKANEITKNNGKRTESPDSLFENNSEKNNTRFEVMTPKKNSKYKTNIDNSEVNINISTEEMFINQDTEDSIVNIENHSSNENEIKNNKHKRTVLTSESLKNNSEKSNTSFKKKCISNNTNSNNLSNRKIRKLNNNITTSDSPICQLDSDLSDILNCIEMLESNEEVNSSDTTEMKFNYNYYHLIDFLTSSDPSLEARSDSAFILSDLSNQIRKCINQHYKVVKKWEIELLRFIGQKILTKILAKYNSAENIMDLCIQVANTNPLHYVETKLSRQPKKEELDKIRKQFPLLKLGVFNKDEDNIIREYWSKFQQEYNISDVKPFLLNGLKMASLSSHEKFNFFRYISAGLPNRLLYSVYNRFNVLFDEKVDRLR